MLGGSNVVVFTVVEILIPTLTVVLGVFPYMIFHWRAKVVARLVPFRFPEFEIGKSGADKYVGAIIVNDNNTLITLQIVNVGKRAARDITIELNGKVVDYLESNDVKKLSMRGNKIPLGYLMPQEKYEMLLTFLGTLPENVKYSDDFLDIKITYKDGFKRLIFGRKDEYKKTIPLKQFEGLLIGKFTSKGDGDSWL